MLLRLVPLDSSQCPTITCSVEFLKDLPETLPLPMSWVNQLDALSQDGLDRPSSIHSLDKAASLPCLLSQVNFDLPTSLVICSFVDGSEVQFPLVNQCAEILNSVAHDVNRASSEELQRQRSTAAQSDSLNSPPCSIKVKGHKKQRSLLRALVASIAPIVSPSRDPVPVIPSPPPSPAQVPSPSPPEEPSPQARALRRQARSKLVDAFRRYVLSELRVESSGMPEGGYYGWIVQSSLQQCSLEMENLVQQARSQSAHFLPPSGSRGYFSSSSAVLSSTEDDGETDTDGSSVHTPSTTHHGVGPFQPTTGTNLSKQLSLPDDINTEELELGNQLSDTLHRLSQLAIVSRARAAYAESDKKQREAMLEIRSRRRAWLNNSLRFHTMGRDQCLGFAMPFQSSRLAQSSWSGDDYEYVQPEPPAYQLGLHEFDERMSPTSPRSRNRSDARLFPVSEEDEWDGDPMHGLNVEEAWPEDVEEGKSLRAVPSRTRTKSMHAEREPPANRPAPALSQSRPRAKPPLYALQVSKQAYQYLDEEFTLAMDLPPSVGKFVGKLDIPVAEPDSDWFAPLISC